MSPSRDRTVTTEALVERIAEALREAHHALLPLNTYRKKAREIIEAAARDEQ